MNTIKQVINNGMSMLEYIIFAALLSFAAIPVLAILLHTFSGAK